MESQLQNPEFRNNSENFHPWMNCLLGQHFKPFSQSWDKLNIYLSFKLKAFFKTVLGNKQLIHTLLCN